jgi:hypothetical protein
MSTVCQQLTAAAQCKYAAAKTNSQHTARYFDNLPCYLLASTRLIVFTPQIVHTGTRIRSSTHMRTLTCAGLLRGVRASAT